MAINSPTSQSPQPPPPRLAWSFNHDASAAARQLRAAEFAAMYLDRIDIQLARVADSLAAGAEANATLLRALDRIASALENRR